MNIKLPIEIDVKNIDYLNYTFCLNGLSFLQEIVVKNTAGVRNLCIEIRSSLAVFEPYNLHFDEVSSDQLNLSVFNLEYNVDLLKNLTEKDIDRIKIVLSSGGIELAATTFGVEVLPMDYFGGLQNYPQLLSSYILPNHPAVYDIKARAVKILEKRGQSPAFEGYQAQNKERVLQVMSALYNAVRQEELIYSAMPASFEKTGQRIRLIHQVLETKFGDCIDISLLFAALLESVDLNPIIILIQGHAFVGVWLDDKRFDSMINFDQAALSKRIAKGIKEIALVETTVLCKGQNLSFNDAVSRAEVQIMNEADFLMSIDIKRTRSYGILPLPIVKKSDFITNNSELRGLSPASIAEEEYDLGETYDQLELIDLSSLTKLKLWERKLLDLSLRNNLLNIRFTRSMLQIIDLKINLLEDTLSEGKTYTIMPDNSQPVTRKYNNYISPLHSSSPIFRLADEEFTYNRLLTTYHHDDLESILTHLYRNSRLAEEENGKSTLYLGLGLLKWYEPKNRNTPRLAPILLIPVELSRRSVKSKFTLRSREEETMINITLVEYLKQEFRLNLDALEQLPMDEFGVDVSKVLAILRNAVLNLEGWDVLEQIVLGNFSFSKLILWQDITKYSDELQKSPIVKSLIEGKLAAGIESLEEDNCDLENLSSAKLKLPIPTDNSQLNAVKSADSGKTFILHGPPGTGKSQTITNIIANALSNKKKVLFVAAKKAALDVVHNRLESIGLGPFCLELHSNKSKKSDVLRQLEESLDVPRYQLNSTYIEKAERLDARKRDLNKYVAFLHQKNKIGWTLYQSISYLEQHSISYQEGLRTDVELENITLSQWNDWKDWLIPYAAMVRKIGTPSDHPLAPISVDTHDIDNKSNIAQAVENYLAEHPVYLWLDTRLDIHMGFLDEFMDVFAAIDASTPEKKLLNILFDDAQKKNLKVWLDLQDNIQRLEAEILTQFHKNIFDLDYHSLRQNWNQAKFSWFLPKWLQQRKVKKILQGYSSSKISTEQHVELAFCQLDERDELRSQQTKSVFQAFHELSHRYSHKGYLDTNQLKNDIDHIETIASLLTKANVDGIEEWLLNASEINFAKEGILQRFEKFVQASKGLERYVFSIPSVDNLKRVSDNLEYLEDWTNYQIYKKQAVEHQLTWFTTFVEEGKIDIDSVQEEFYKILHFNHFIQKVYARQELKAFDASIYETQIKQFRDLHSEFTSVSRNQLIAQLSSNIPNLNREAAQSSEVGLLQRAIRSRGRGVSIRRLFDQIPNLLPRLKPCMLMSPISVAQYFDVSDEHFDLVIFDEASQLPTSESISALARAKQAVIVGDPKQMPPTSFFSSSKVDEDNLEMEDLESILEDCLALSIPSKYLLRHYRSKHESLIAFSNKNFYDSKLLTFPSPDDLNQKVTFEFVQGFYDKGKTRTNSNEAIAVISYIKTHLASKNNKSIGVVTFNQAQQNLIEDLLQKLFVDYPELEAFSLENEDTIFIKNLENVQGDERDIILFSVGYGPDEYGGLSMNFGPLNRDGGWRRLNVAVTRARYEMKVFSSLRGDQIDLARTNAEGVKGLKEFLNFAEKGSQALRLSSNESNRATLIDSIAKHLEKNGFVVRKHIGTSEYRVDVGIVHPKNEKEYIIGILVDGDTYFNIETTNDRELLAPNVLEALGWRIFRIWTLDWIKNKELILEQLKREVEANLAHTDEQFIEIGARDDNLSNDLLVEIDRASTSTSQMPYESAAVHSVPFADSESIYFVENRAVILTQMKEIIDIEAPISKNQLFRKILKLWNTSRAGAKLNNYLTDILGTLPDITFTSSHQEFIWNTKVTPENLARYRDNGTEKRSIDDIAAEELSIAIMEIMNSNLSMDKMDLSRMLSRAFGFMKVGRQIEHVVNQTIDKLVAEERLILHENRISLGV